MICKCFYASLHVLSVIQSCMTCTNKILRMSKSLVRNLGLYVRGGVEDTTLEAKATKKIRGQGEPFRGQTLSRPRTKYTAASVFQKKDLQKSFSGNLQFIRVARIFDWRGLNHKSHAMTSSKICLLALNQDFAKREGFN